jgi:hypothetical protein
MSAFYEHLYRQANNLESVAEQRAFYERAASSFSAGYGYGFDMAADFEQRAANGIGNLALPAFLAEQDDSLQGFLDYHNITSHSELDSTDFVKNFALVSDVTVTNCYEQLSDIDRFIFNTQRFVPSLPALRIAFYRVKQVSQPQLIAA